MTIHDISKSTVGLQHESFFVQAFWQLFYLKKKEDKAQKSWSSNETWIAHLIVGSVKSQFTSATV